MNVAPAPSAHRADDEIVEADGDRLDACVDAADLRALPGVQDAEVAPSQVRLKVASVHGVVPALLRLFADRGVELRGLATRHATLEDVFVRLTGRHLREDAR